METRNSKDQGVGKYDLMRIRISKRLTDLGFEMWYWHIFPGAFDCPKEPFTQAFWKTQGAILLHGIALPGMAEEDRGDLIVLLTQKINGDDGTTGDKQIAAILIREFYPRLLKLPFPHARTLAAAPTPLRKELIAKLEQVFVEEIAPHESYN